MTCTVQKGLMRIVKQGMIFLVVYVDNVFDGGSGSNCINCGIGDVKGLRFDNHQIMMV